MTKISEWRLDKNVKDSEMRAMIRKASKRKFREDKDSLFRVRGREVEPEKIERFKKRKGLEDEDEMLDAS